MILFSLYLIVSTTLLVQSLHSARRSHFQIIENPHQGYQRNAFPQSKDSIANPTSEEKREAAKTKGALHLHKHSPVQFMEHKSKKCAHNTAEPKRPPEWAMWTEWSSCSVTCGKGREIRWRHCLENCKGIETEMEEKTCQLPACEGKLFGLIKL